jgi:hypothetical protein
MYPGFVAEVPGVNTERQEVFSPGEKGFDAIKLEVRVKTA